MNHLSNIKSAFRWFVYRLVDWHWMNHVMAGLVAFSSSRRTIILLVATLLSSSKEVQGVFTHHLVHVSHRVPLDKVYHLHHHKGEAGIEAEDDLKPVAAKQPAANGDADQTDPGTDYDYGYGGYDIGYNHGYGFVPGYGYVHPNYGYLAYLKRSAAEAEASPNPEDQAGSSQESSEDHMFGFGGLRDYGLGGYDGYGLGHNYGPHGYKFHPYGKRQTGNAEENAFVDPGFGHGSYNGLSYGPGYGYAHRYGHNGYRYGVYGGRLLYLG